MTQTVDPAALAREFSRVLREWLTAEQMATVNATNARPENARFCASHEFCDANMAMLEAYSTLTGIPENDVDLNEAADVMNPAWDIAKATQFAV